MGLLDFLNDSSNAGAMGLLAASGPSRMPVSLGQGLASGYQAAQDQENMNLRRQSMQQGLEMNKMHMDQMKKALLQQEEAKVNLQNYVSSLPDGHPMKSQIVQAINMGVPLSKVWEKLNPDAKFETIFTPDGKETRGWVTPSSVTQVGGTKAEGSPAPIQEYNFAVGQGFKGTFDQWDLQRRRAAANVTNVNMDNLGLKPKDRFEMEDKLRNDYVKAVDLDQKILGISQKMKAILSGDPNAMKDQAAIYSFAKLLDPDGAVRESDYAAITNTAGLADRMKNYVNKLATGQMLTQNQRNEMENILKQWEGVANKRISAQQKSYTGRAKMYNLTPENVFQTPDAISGGAKFLGFE